MNLAASDFGAFGKAFGNASLIMLARVSGAFTTLLYTLLLTAVASAEEVGRAFAAISLALVLSVVASFNIEAGAIRYLPLYLEKGRKNDATGFVLSARYATFGVSFLMGSIAVAMLSSGASLTMIGPYLVAMAAAPILANTRINSRYAVAMGLVLQASVPRLLVRPVLFALVLVMCWGFDISLNASQIMLVFLGAACLTAGLQWILIRPAFAFRREATACFSEASDWASLGLLLVPMLFLNEHMRDVVILSASLVLPSDGIACLGIALSLVGLLVFALATVDMVLSPRISRAILKDQSTQRAQLIVMSGLAKLLLFLVGVPTTYLLIPKLLSLLGSAYQSVGDTYLLLVPMALAIAVFGPGSIVLNVLGKSWELFYAALLSGAILVASVVLGGVLGDLDGVAIGISLAVSVYHGILFSICRYRANIDTTVLAMFWDRRAVPRDVNAPERKS